MNGKKWMWGNLKCRAFGRKYEGVYELNEEEEPYIDHDQRGLHIVIKVYNENYNNEREIRIYLKELLSAWEDQTTMLDYDDPEDIKQMVTSFDKFAKKLNNFQKKALKSIAGQ
jgi:hypothetical protein